VTHSWVLFDADGTLFDYDRAEKDALTTTFEEDDHVCSSETLEAYREINGRMWRDFEQGLSTIDRIKTERFETLFSHIWVDLDPVAFNDRYIANLSRQAELIEGAVETVTRLAEKVGLLLITNGLAGVQRPRVAKSPIRRFFQDLVISEEVGSAKPDRKIFDAAFSKMNYPVKRSVLMVGDSLSSDIKGGNDYGIDTCWFNPHRHQRADEIEPAYEVQHLRQIIELVDGAP
jgi:2-haloacid dehalogenase